MTYKRILIAVDGSDASEKALDYAIDLANEGTALTVLNVAELPYSRLPTMRSKDIYGPYLNMVKESHNKILDDAIKTISEKAPNAQVNRILAIGDPAKKITEVGNAGDYDLIITGCRELT
jgi:nucleotide-binding universal stress UspA family protein